MQGMSAAILVGALARARVMRTPKRGVIWDLTDGHCFYCRTMLLDDDYFAKCGCRLIDENRHLSMHCDHKTPSSRGGNDDPANIAPACAFCNVQKNNRTVEEYAQYLFRRNILPNFWGQSLDRRDWLLLNTYPPVVEAA